MMTHSPKAAPARGNGSSRKQPRQSNMELLRLLSMLLVLIVHANAINIDKLDLPTFNRAPAMSVLYTFIEQLSIVCVNVFVLISGWFGIRPRWQGMANLLFQALFLPSLIMAAFFIARQPELSIHLQHTLYPGWAYWFITAYMGLYVISPLLNAFAENASQKQMKRFLIAFFAFEFFYGFVVDLALFHVGFSTFSFIGLYLLAQYMRRYPGKWFSRSGKTYFGLYLLTMAASTFAFIALMYLVGHDDNRRIFYNSPFVILGSACLLLCFSRLQLQSRLVNKMAASCLAVYLVHYHPLLYSQCFKPFFADLYTRFSGVGGLLLAFLCLLGIGVGCILLDRLRIFCWKRLLPLLEKAVGKIGNDFGGTKTTLKES